MQRGWSGKEEYQMKGNRRIEQSRRWEGIEGEVCEGDRKEMEQETGEIL